MIIGTVGAGGGDRMVQREVVQRTRESIARIEQRTRRSLAHLELNLRLKRKSVVKALAALCLPLIALIIHLIDPVKKFGQYYMTMAEGYHGYALWHQPSVGAYSAVYIFNVTNSEQFLSGEHKSLKVEEVGPFTYLESRTNENMTIDREKGVLRFIPRTKTTFVPEKSIGDPRDFNITIPNLALLTTSSMLADYPYWTTVAFNLLLANLGTKPFLHLSIQEYMWGFSDKLVTMAHTVLPGWISTPQLGLLLKLYEETEEFVEIELRESDRYRIRSWGGQSALPQWMDSEKYGSVCNHLNGSYEGINYSAEFSENTTYHMYRRQACRTIPMSFRGRSYSDFGAEVLLFSPREDAFDPKPENDCICKKGKCLPRGMSDLSPCYMGMSFSISRPHCLYCDPAVFDKIEGLRPDPLLHESIIAVDPKMGLPLMTTSMSQSNVVVKDVRYITRAKQFSNIIYPMFWIKLEFQELPASLKQLLRMRLVVGPALQVALVVLLALCGLAVCTYHAYYYLRPRPTISYECLPLGKELDVFVYENPLMDDVDL